MKIAKFTTSCKKDIKRQKKRGKSKEKRQTIVEMICRDGDPPAKCHPHDLVGNWVN